MGFGKFVRSGLVAIAVTLPAGAKSEDGKQVVCNVSGCSEIVLPAPKFSQSNAFSTQKVWTVINEIMAVSGLLPNFQVLETDEVANAAAVVIDEERYLAFNGEWIAQYKDNPESEWQLLGLMAHEIGHHLQGHTITSAGSRPPTELEADEYAGFVLAALGASVAQAQSLWATLPEGGSSTHPPKYQRLLAVERGWLRRNGGNREEVVPVISGPEHAPTPSGFAKNCIGMTSSLGAGRLCASSVLGSQSGNSYGTANLIDDDLKTAWVEGVGGHGIGQGLLFTFDSPSLITEIALRNGYGKTIIMVEQNAKKGLEFADIGYVLVSGEVAIAGKGDDLLDNPDVGRLFLGG